MGKEYGEVIHSEVIKYNQIFLRRIHQSDWTAANRSSEINTYKGREITVLKY